MNSKFKMMLFLASGVAIGGLAVHGLHAQGKPKAYTVSELETIDAAANAAYATAITAAQTAAGGRNLFTAGGKVVAMEGAAPKRVAMTEWSSLEAAEAFYKSKAWNDLEPQRAKSVKTIKRYAVEATK
jgi:uncharacterized protein (DUF1330 family)